MTSEQPHVPATGLSEHGGIRDDLVGTLDESGGHDGVVFEHEGVLLPVIDHPLPDRDVGQGAPDPPDGIELFMGSTGVGDDVPFGEGGNACVGQGVEGFPVHAEEPLDRQPFRLYGGLILETTPSIRTTLEGNTEGGDGLDGPGGCLLQGPTLQGPTLQGRMINGGGHVCTISRKKRKFESLLYRQTACVAASKKGMVGHLTVLMGCMFAQKTTELIRRIRRYQSIGYSVLVVNHSTDTRYGTACVASHDRAQERAVAVSALTEVDAAVTSGDYQVVVVDEGQFFDDLFACVTRWVDQYPVHVVVAGLDGTAAREPFGDILRLVPHAEEVERLTAFCAVCRDGTAAMFSQFLGAPVASSASPVAVGAAEMYRPVCRRHYLAGAGSDTSKENPASE